MADNPIPLPDNEPAPVLFPGNPPPEPCAEPVIPEPDPEVVGTDTEGRN